MDKGGETRLSTGTGEFAGPRGEFRGHIIRADEISWISCWNALRNDDEAEKATKRKAGDYRLTSGNRSHLRIYFPHGS